MNFSLKIIGKNLEQDFPLTHIRLYIHCIHLVMRIPEHIHFPFYDFSMIYYELSKLQLDYGIRKRENHIIQTLWAKVPEFFTNQPASSSTIHVSHEIYIGNPRKASILTPRSFFFFLRTKSRGSKAEAVGEAETRPKKGQRQRRREARAPTCPPAPVGGRGAMGGSR
jgi:hypothetical protein